MSSIVTIPKAFSFDSPSKKINNWYQGVLSQTDTNTSSEKSMIPIVPKAWYSFDYSGSQQV